MTPDVEVAYRQFEAELFKRELSNSENYDKAILTSASGGLALSLAFIQAVVPLATAQHLWFLKVSWLALSLSILTVIASFQLSQRALAWERERTIRMCEEDEGKKKAREERNEIAPAKEVNRLNKATIWTNLAGGVFFLAGVLFTMIFVWINLGNTAVIKTPNTNSQAETMMVKPFQPTETKSVPVHDGAPAPTLYKSNPANPAVPAPAPAPAPASNSTTKKS